MAAYYPRRVATFKDLQKAYPEYETYDDDEEDRVEHVQMYVLYSPWRGGNEPKDRAVTAMAVDHITDSSFTAQSPGARVRRRRRGLQQVCHQSLRDEFHYTDHLRHRIQEVRQKEEVVKSVLVGVVAQLLSAVSGAAHGVWGWMFRGSRESSGLVLLYHYCTYT